MPEVDCIRVKSGETVSLLLAGEWSQRLKEALRGARPVVVDLTGAEELDLGMLQLLFAARTSFARRGVAFTLVDSAGLYAATAARAGMEEAIRRPGTGEREAI